jgi:flagellar protein FlgJ
MNLTPIDPRTLLSSSPKTIDPKSEKARDLKSLRESTREFEALFINEMFKAMRKTVPDGGLIEKDMSEDIFREMMDMELARSASSGKGIGLGEDMFEQLRHLIDNRLDR